MVCHARTSQQEQVVLERVGGLMVSQGRRSRHELGCGLWYRWLGRASDRRRSGGEHNLFAVVKEAQLIALDQVVSGDILADLDA
jgi:hypothetical protein